MMMISVVVFMAASLLRTVLRRPSLCNSSRPARATLRRASWLEMDKAVSDCSQARAGTAMFFIIAAGAALLIACPHFLRVLNLLQSQAIEVG